MAEIQNTTWKEFINTTTVSDLVKRKHFPLVTLKRNVTLKEALHVTCS